METIVICSGRLDSVSLARKAAAEHMLLGLWSFDYDQRHRPEVTFAACTDRSQVPHRTIDNTGIGHGQPGPAPTAGLPPMCCHNFTSCFGATSAASDHDGERHD
jgi:7-cyano-7-deazaguanine synthase